MGFGEGEGKLSSESFPSPSPIFFPALSYDQEVLHAREDDLRGDGGEKQAGELGKHRKAGLAEDALHMVRHEQHERDERRSHKEGGRTDDAFRHAVGRRAENHQRTDAGGAHADGDGERDHADVLVRAVGGVGLALFAHEGYGSQEQERPGADAEGVQREAEYAEQRFPEKVQHRPHDEDRSPRPQGRAALAASAVGLRPAQEGAQGRGRRQQGEKLDDRTEKISDTVIHTSSHYPAKRLLNARGIARTGRIFDWLFNEPGHHTRNVG